MPHKKRTILSNQIAFTLRFRQICQQLKQDKISTVGLWFDDAQLFACALLACLEAQVKILLPPNLLPENRKWIADNTDLFLTEESFSNYGITQQISEITPFQIDNTNLTEILLKTSGSSGQAKIIVKTARQMWLEAEALTQILPFEKGQVITLLGSVSSQHLYGLTFRIFLALNMEWNLGNKQLQYPEYLIAESNHCQKAIWVSSPALLNNLNLNNEALMQCNLIGIISSGGVLPDVTANQLRNKLNIPIVEIYGSTETGVVAMRQDSGLWKILSGSEIGTNEQGALWVKSAWIDHKEQTSDAIEMSDNGNSFKLLGRIDRIVKLGDKRISLVQIEQELLTHAWIKDCYVALHPIQHRPVAWVALTDLGIAEFKQRQRKEVVNELKQFLSMSQEKLALPRFWRFTTALPRNSQSKIDRSQFERICVTQQDEIY